MKPEHAPEWRARIVIDPRILGGRPVIKGTRVPVQIIVGELAGGSTISEVCDGYLLEEQDVRAALAYAAELLAEEKVYALPGR